MWKFIVKRVLLMIPIILGVTLVVFTIMYFTPGSPGELMAGTNPDPEVIEQINHDLGFDQPFHIRYFNFLKGIVTKLDFGTSYISQRPVLGEIMSRFPRTLTLAFFSMITTAIVGIAIGILSAVKQYRFDRESVAGISQKTLKCYEIFREAQATAPLSFLSVREPPCLRQSKSQIYSPMPKWPTSSVPL